MYKNIYSYLIFRIEQINDYFSSSFKMSLLMKLYFIRHTSVDVPEGVIYGQTDVPLRASFEQEAEIVSSKIQDLDFGAVFVSPLTRCVRLADYCGYKEAIRDERIKEIHMGDWEMKSVGKPTSFREVHKEYNLLTTQPPNGESFSMLYNRVSEFINEIKQLNHEVVAIFAHGGVLASAQVYSGDLLPHNILDGLAPYGGIIQIEV
mgnify:CR=1 FL=1